MAKSSEESAMSITSWNSNPFYMPLMAAQRFNIRLQYQDLTNEDILRPYNHSIKADGSIAVLMGSLAPEGSFIRHAACLKEVFEAVLHARPFDSEKEGRTPFLLRPENPSFTRLWMGSDFFFYRKIEDKQ